MAGMAINPLVLCMKIMKKMKGVNYAERLHWEAAELESDVTSVQCPCLGGVFCLP